MWSDEVGEVRWTALRLLLWWSNRWWDLAAREVGHFPNKNILPIMQQGSFLSFLTGADSVQL